MFRNTIRLTGILAAVFMIASCDAGSFIEPEETGGAGNPVQVAAEITIGATLSMVAEDDTIPLEAAVLDQDGALIADTEIQWNSTDENVAHVEPDGSGSTLIAGRPGTATLTASYADVSTSATVEVHKRPVDLVYVSGSGQKGDPGTELTDSLAVRIIDKRGDAVSDVAISFVVVSGGGSASPQAGTTDAEGRLSAAWTLGASGSQVVEAQVSAAQARVNHVKDSVVVFTARFSDATGESQVASVTVSPPSDTVVAGSTAQLRATVRDANGNELTGRSVRWSSSDTTVATVDDAGVVAGRAKGHIAALAKVDGVSGAADVTVADSGDGTLIITSSVDTLVGIGTSATFTAEARTADGSLLPDPDIQWTSSNPNIATVDSMGTVIARALGVTVIAASAVCCDSGDFVGLAVVEDNDSAGSGEVAYVVASPSSQTFASLGATRQINATAWDTLDQVVPDVDFSFSSTDPSVVGVDSTGTMTANSLGAAAIIVAAMGTGFTDTVQAQVDTTAAQPFFSDDFETGDTSHSEGGFSWDGGGARAEGTAYSGSYARRFRYGPDADGEDSSAEQRFVIDAALGLTELWIEYMLYVPDNFAHRDDSPNNNKLLAIWNTRYNESTQEVFVIWEYTRVSDTESQLRIASAKADGYEDRKPYQAATILGTLFDASMRGTWIRLRYHIKAEVDASILDVWRDGTKIGEIAADYSIVAPAWVGSRDTFLNGYLMGWSNSGFTEQTDFWIDDFKVYDQDPKW